MWFARLLGLLVGFAMTAGLVIGLLAVSGRLSGLIFLCLVFFWGLSIYSLVYYRAIRQDELRQVLVTAAESRSPMAHSVFAYAADRPWKWWRLFLEGALANVLVLGSYWSWHKHRRFDRRVTELADRLESGVPLSQALWMTPGVANRETKLAVAVGESTGDLAGPLTHVSKTRMNEVAIESLPRLAYPVILLFIQVSIVSFIVTFIIPKFEKIFADFHVRLPEETQLFLSTVRTLSKWSALIAFGTAVVFLVIVPALIFSPTFRWRCPGVSRIERPYSQGRLLKMLGMLLAAGKTAPAALELLSREEYLGRAVQKQLLNAASQVGAGQPLIDELFHRGLMPASMAPFVRAAERARNLPWGLEEAGETLTRRARRLAQRLSSAVGPLGIAILGLSTAAVAVSVFMPLVSVITALTPK